MATKKVDSVITKETTINKSITKPRLLMIAGGVVVLLIVVAYQFKGLFVTAWVNGTPITRAAYVKNLETQGGKQVLNQMITEQLISEAAQKKNITVAPEEITAEVASITENLKSQGQELNQALDEQGMTLKDLERQITLRQLVEQLTADQATVSAEEITQYIADNKSSLPTSKEASAAEIEAMVLEQLTTTKQQTAVNTWLTDLKSGADIQYW